MAAPKNPNPGPAAAKNARKGQETKAQALRAAGWWTIAPDQLEQIAERLRATGRYGSEAAEVVDDVLTAAVGPADQPVGDTRPNAAEENRG